MADRFAGEESDVFNFREPGTDLSRVPGAEACPQTSCRWWRHWWSHVRWQQRLLGGFSGVVLPRWMASLGRWGGLCWSGVDDSEREATWNTLGEWLSDCRSKVSVGLPGDVAGSRWSLACLCLLLRAASITSCPSSSRLPFLPPQSRPLQRHLLHID